MGRKASVHWPETECGSLIIRVMRVRRILVNSLAIEKNEVSMRFAVVDYSSVSEITPAF